MANKHYTPEEDKILLREMNSTNSMLSFDDKALSASNEIYAKLFIKRSTTSVMARYRHLSKVSGESIAENKKPVYHSDPVKQAEAEEIIRRANLTKEERENLKKMGLNESLLKRMGFDDLVTEDQKKSLNDMAKSVLTDAQKDFKKLLSEAEEERSAIHMDKYEAHLRSMENQHRIASKRNEEINPGFINEINGASKRKLRLMRTMIDYYLGGE